MRLAALAGALGLVGVGCGSRLSQQELRAANGNPRGPAEAGPSPVPQGSGSAGARGVIGTLTSGCSPDRASGPETTGTPGVTADAIRIGMISDRAGVIPVPTAGMEESFKSFVAFCNDHGGIHGRKLVLKTYDSGVFKDAEVTQQACSDNLFALVGTGSVQDQQGAQTRVDCGLPEVAGYTATAERGLSDGLVQPLQSQGALFNSGSCRYLASRYPAAVTMVASLYTDLPAAADWARSWEQACTRAAGYHIVDSRPVPPLSKDWGPIVSELKEKGVRYLMVTTDLASTLGLLRTMKDQSFKPEVIDLGEQYYDAALAADPNADGALVSTSTTPFEDTDNPALRTYRAALEKTAPGTVPTGLGVQSFSAGLLFAQAAAALGNHLTRQGLLDQLHTIHHWDGGGLEAPSDPGSNLPGLCFLYLRVRNGRFVRDHPTKGFDCNPKYAIRLIGYSRTGAHRAHP